MVTEVKFAIEVESYSIILTSHGCQVDLTTVFQFECLEQPPNWEQIESVLTTIDNSTLCCGVPIADGEVLHTMLPHETGFFFVLSTNKTPETVERRAFSASCSILSRAGQCCSICKHLHYLDKQRQKRKLETNGVISPSTNKRFLSKEEVTKQLQLERQARINAEKRERYWREKFEAECIEMESDDHADLSKMFQGVGDNVPDSMASLWEQQQNLLRCKTKNAYRWHPKYVN